MRFGRTQVRNAEFADAWLPEMCASLISRLVTMVTFSRFGSSGDSVGDSVVSRPVSAGVHGTGFIPIGMYT